MSTGYPVPPVTFDAGEHARNKLDRANQGRSAILQQYVSMFCDFWGVSEVGRGSRHTRAEMQQIVDRMTHAVFLRVLSDSVALRSLINNVAPGSISPEHSEAAFTLTITAGVVVVGPLRSVWQIPAEPADAAGAAGIKPTTRLDGGIL